jgi:hypothetical protein
MHKSIKLVENPDDAEIETIPHPVEAAGGDTLSWKSDEGEIRVTFADPHPFDTPAPPELFAGKGHNTAEVRIRQDVWTGQHFDYVVSVDDRGPKAVYGIDIRP